MRFKHTIADMQKIALLRGGRCLSSIYGGIYKKLEWECEKQHKWMAKPGNIIYRKSWCPYCANRVKNSIDDMQALARDKNGYLVSTKYINGKTPLIWQCGNCGSSFHATPQSVRRGSWCPKCSKQNLSENKCRFVFEQLTQKLFPTDRTVLYGLELDGYNAELKIAFEHQGIQHYQYVPFFHKRQTLTSIQQRDQYKSLLCKNLNITILQIPYYLSSKTEKLEQFIRNFLLSHNIKCKTKVNWRHFSPHSRNLRILQDLAASRNGKLLSEYYLGSNHLHSWKCLECDSIFKLRPRDAKQGVWCKTCAIKKNALKNMLSISDMQKLALTHSGEFLSLSYTGGKNKHQWRCGQCSTIFSKAPCFVKDGQWCPSCGYKNSGKKSGISRTKTVKDMQKLAASQHGTFLSVTYSSSKHKYWWQCGICLKKFHKSPNTVQQRQLCSRCKHKGLSAPTSEYQVGGKT